MSAIRCTVPGDPLYSWTFPSGPTGTMTRFGMFCPAWKFRFEVSCRGVPDGHTVMYPAAAGAAAVTFRATADTPAAGTPPCPVTCTEIDPVDGTGPGAPWPIRVSMIRAGGNDTTAPGAVGGAVTETGWVSDELAPRASVTVSVIW